MESCWVAIGSPSVDHWHRRLTGWTVVVALMALVAYGARVSGDRPPKDVAFRWGSMMGEKQIVLGAGRRAVDMTQFAFRPDDPPWKA